jgi:hypothetical protein
MFWGSRMALGTESYRITGTDCPNACVLSITKDKTIQRFMLTSSITGSEFKK